MTRLYDLDIPVLRKGGIHIKKKNRGKFTESAKRAGMGVQEYARHVLANKDKYSSTLVKRANFARNAKKFKHENGGILKYQNPATTLDLPEGSEYGGELKPAVVKPKPYLGILNTHYPIISKYPFTGHSELDLCDSNGVYVDHISKYGDDYDYNLVTNNCSDATRRAVEQIFNEKINPSLFTTPGDVRDFLLKKGVDVIDTAKGVETQYFEIPFATAMDLKNQNIDFHIQNHLKWAEEYKKDMEKWAKSHDRKWNSSKFDKTTTKTIEELENQKYKFQPFKNKNGGILKAQEGTGNLYAPQPLSPLDIALNQAKIMSKTKKEQPQQQQLPPGVKEVIGLDGQKIVIRTEQPLQPLEQNIAEWLPGTGDVAEVGYIADDVKNGRYGSATLAAGLTFIPGNWRKVLDTLTPSKKDKFLDFFSKEIGKTVKRVPVTKNDFQGVYSEGFRYLDESGKEIAHIAGSRYGDRVFVESSFMDPEFRSKGIGKQMYFDFNDQMFNKYGKTIGSDSGQHMMTLETSPGIFISPSGRMWRGLRNKGLATTENPPIVSYIMAEPKIIKPYKKYSKGGKL